MLVLSRKLGQGILLRTVAGEPLATVVVMRAGRDSSRVKLAIDAPQHVRIARCELADEDRDVDACRAINVEMVRRWRAAHHA